ncbi:hypothetical protein ACLQ7P_20775 [Bacillus subtilis subsp. subtilis]
MKAARFEAVHELKDRYPITWLVCIAKVSRSGYYKWRKAQRIRMAREQREQIIKEHIMAFIIHALSMAILGLLSL